MTASGLPRRLGTLSFHGPLSEGRAERIASTTAGATRPNDGSRWAGRPSASAPQRVTS
ncbi:hypothetical protein [Streptomyces sp. NPDC002990]